MTAPDNKTPRSPGPQANLAAVNVASWVVVYGDRKCCSGANSSLKSSTSEDRELIHSETIELLNDSLTLELRAHLLPHMEEETNFGAHSKYNTNFSFPIQSICLVHAKEYGCQFSMEHPWTL